MSTTKLITPVSQEDLQAEIDKLKAENATLKQAEGAAPAHLVGGMTDPANKVVTVIPQQPFRGERIAATTRTDMGFDPTQRFSGRQP